MLEVWTPSVTMQGVEVWRYHGLFEVKIDIHELCGRLLQAPTFSHLNQVATASR